MNYPAELVIASDHAGFELKEVLKSYLEAKKIKITDLGTKNKESVDYPDYAHQLANYVIKNNVKGLLICGSGIGMSMAVNKHKDIRAALCTSVEMAKLSREHNDANVLVLGARLIDTLQAIAILDTWLNTDFEGGRHQRRVKTINP